MYDQYLTIINYNGENIKIFWLSSDIYDILEEIVSTKINEQLNIADITLISDILPSENIVSHFNIAIYVKWEQKLKW